MVPWKVWTFGIGACACAYLMHLDAVKTHTRRGCIPIVLLHGSHGRRIWALMSLSEIHIQVSATDWAQVGQESKQVGQVSLHLFSSVPGMCK